MEVRASRVVSEPEHAISAEGAAKADDIAVVTGYTTAELLAAASPNVDDKYEHFADASYPVRNREREHSPKLYKPRVARIPQGIA